MVEVDDYSGELYWREDEVARRLVLLEGDVRDMVYSNVLIARKISDIVCDGKVDPYIDGYEKAVQDYTEGLQEIIRRRFKEIVVKLEVREE